MYFRATSPTVNDPMNMQSSTGAKESTFSTEPTTAPAPRPRDMASAAQVVTALVALGGTTLVAMLRAKARTRLAKISTASRPRPISEICAVTACTSKLKSITQARQAKASPTTRPLLSLQGTNRSSRPRLRLNTPQISMSPATNKALAEMFQPKTCCSTLTAYTSTPVFTEEHTQRCQKQAQQAANCCQLSGTRRTGSAASGPRRLVGSSKKMSTLTEKKRYTTAMNHPGMVSESSTRLLIFVNFMNTSRMAARAGPTAQPKVSMAA
mmetsp:Transcript_46593/g.110784  ORF Transcript_46593/g.110784 Transcript_46593/m.110784 type:complete len:267 (-) Transcript_46593:527-1327(-)